MTTTFSHLDTPGKRRHMKQHLQRVRALRRQVERKTAQLEKVQQQSTMIVHEDLSSDLATIMDSAAEEISKLPDTSFKRMFWEQQVCTTID